MSLRPVTCLFAGCLFAASVLGVGAQQRSPGRVLLQEAVGAFRSAQYEEAAPRFAELLDRYEGEPSWESLLPRVRFLLACSLFNLNRMEEARELFRTILAEDESDPFARESVFRLANIAQADGNTEEALGLYARILEDPGTGTLAARARFETAQCLFDAERFDEAATLLDAFVDDAPRELGGQARALLALSFVRVGRFADAERRALEAVQQAASIEEAVLLNATLIGIGDQLIAEGETRRGLRCHQAAWSPVELRAWQQDAVNRLRRQLEIPTSRGGGFDSYWERRRTRQRLQIEADRLGQLDDAPTSEALVLVRVARSFRQLNRPREALIAARRAFAQQPSPDVRRVATLECALALEALGRDAEAAEIVLAAVDPEGEKDADLALAAAAALLRGGRAADALDLVRPALTDAPDAARLPERLLLAGRAAIAIGQPATAEQALRRLLEECPESEVAHDASYWRGVALLELRRYEDAVGFLQAFLDDEDPAADSPVASDARYRLALGLRARGRVEEAAAALEPLLDNDVGAPLRARALALLGDLKAGIREFDAAVDAYRGVSSGEPEAYRYAVHQAARLLRARRRYEEVVDLMTGFLGTGPSASESADANIQIAEARIAAAGGWTEEAADDVRAAVEAAGDDPFCEELDRGLARLEDTATRTGFGQQVADAVGSAPADAESVAAARRTYWIARFASGDPRSAAARLIADHPSTDAGPYLGVARGDALLQSGDLIGASQQYEAVADRYPEALSTAFARLGLARCALERGDPAAALAWIEQAAEADLPPPERALVEVARADALRDSGDIDGALLAYRQILSRRAWRGPAWPAALFGGGLCYEEQGDPRKAFAYYQRIYVLYGTYEPWVAQAYLASARCLEALDRDEDAVRTYRELLANSRMRRFPAYGEAEQRLRALESAGSEG